MREPRALLILDACVLIDFAKTDRSVLRLASVHIGPVHVATPVFDEVGQLDASEAAGLGLRLCEPPLEIAMEAARLRGALSFQDWLCVLLAAANGWTCVSNDGRLRKECGTRGVQAYWGLELVAMLVEKGAVLANDAREIGAAIQASNPRFITPRIFGRFLKRIGLSE